MKIMALAFLSVLIFGCSGEDHSELKEWMANVARDAKGKIDPLPEVKPYEPVPYDVANIIDPFKPSKIGIGEKKIGGGGLQPDLERPKEPLEAYPLESLKFVGVLSKKKASYAIILVDGSLYQVKVGNHMGQDFGIVTKISESEVGLKELIQDSNGDWTERASALLLQEQGGIK